MKNPFSEEAYSRLVDELSAKFPSFGTVGAAAYKPGLDRMETFCRIIGNPQNTFRSIHIAGTNGKGSTCNMLAAHFAAKGLKTGLYTSPHISDFRERARIVTGHACSLIPKETVWDFINEYEAEFERLGLSYFEITTAMAFAFFSSEKVDIAIIETGLGGRLDATNIITPAASVITGIGFDHMDILGHTLPEIAGEKAGIMKKGVPVIIGEDSALLKPLFEEKASENGSPLFFAQSRRDEAEKFTARFDMDLNGPYQKANLATALTVLEVLGEKPECGAIANAAKICGFHGRWEQISSDPLIICDIGHNRHGLEQNFARLNEMLDSGRTDGLVMVYGSVSDKDYDAVLQILPQRAYIYFTSAGNQRAEKASVLLARSGHSGGQATESVADAVAAALEHCKKFKCPLLYIGGSTYVVSEAVSFLKDKISR